MNALSRILVRVLPAALLAATLAGGCVRSEEPDRFLCSADDDCDDGEKCDGVYCIDESACDSDFQCRSGQVCRNLKCVEPACREGDGSCGNFECRSGFCPTSCSGGFECKSGYSCVAGTCVLPGVGGGGGSGGSSGTPFKGGLGSICITGNDCQSGICCAQSAGASACASEACPVAECFSSAQCAFGQECVEQKCITPRLNGEACDQANQCQNKSCIDGVCRGIGIKNDTCDADVDCAANRPCCEGLLAGDFVCGDPDRGCPGSIGDGCEFDFDCTDGDCNGSFCSKPCTSNVDCGISPWGIPNACETNGLGNRICFPGCTSYEQCWDNVSASLSCVSAIDSNAFICAAD